MEDLNCNAFEFAFHFLLNLFLDQSQTHTAFLRCASSLSCIGAMECPTDLRAQRQLDHRVSELFFGIATLTRMESVTIKISKGLAEQLAGVPKERGAKDKRSQAPRSKENQETLAFLKESEEIRGALRRSRKVGKLLLKREDEELEKINAQADELGQLPTMKDPSSDACRLDREAVAACCEQHADGVLGCVSLIDAYAACTNKRFVDSMAAAREQLT